MYAFLARRHLVIGAGVAVGSRAAASRVLMGFMLIK